MKYKIRSAWTSLNLQYAQWVTIVPDFFHANSEVYYADDWANLSFLMTQSHVCLSHVAA